MIFWSTRTSSWRPQRRWSREPWVSACGGLWGGRPPLSSSRGASPEPVPRCILPAGRGSLRFPAQHRGAGCALPPPSTTLLPHRPLRLGRAGLRGAGEEERGRCRARAAPAGSGHPVCSAPPCSLRSPCPCVPRVPVFPVSLRSPCPPHMSPTPLRLSAPPGAVHRQLAEVRAGDGALPARPPVGGEDGADAAGAGTLRGGGSGAGRGRGRRGAALTSPPRPVPQEERAAFDIHSYGERLAAQFEHLGEWRSFSSLVSGMPAFEVCRYMLASLQLVSGGPRGWGDPPGGSAQPSRPLPPLRRPTTTRWRWRRTRAWRRRWTPCGSGSSGTSRPTSASAPTAPPCSATEPPQSCTAPPPPVQPPIVYSPPPAVPPCSAINTQLP